MDALRARYRKMPAENISSLHIWDFIFFPSHQVWVVICQIRLLIRIGGETCQIDLNGAEL